MTPTRPSTTRNRTSARRRAAALPAIERLEDRLQPDGNPLNKIDHFVVIYQENWSFDALYGSSPGVNGLANASTTSLTQIDRRTGQPSAHRPASPSTCR
jgi:phospholipase C